MPASMRSRQPNQSRPRIRIQMRSPLPHQIRSPQKPIRPPWHFGGFGRQPFIRITPVIRASTKPITEPPQRLPSSLSNSHHVPPSRHSMTKRMQAPLGIQSRTIRSSKHNSRSPNRRRHRARSNNPHSRSASCLIPSPSDHRSSSLQPSSRSSRSRNLPSNIGRLVQLRQQRFIHLRRLQNLLRPPPVGDI